MGHGSGFAAARDAELALDTWTLAVLRLMKSSAAICGFDAVGQSGAPRARAGSTPARPSRSRPALPRARPPRSAGARAGHLPPEQRCRAAASRAASGRRRRALAIPPARNLGWRSSAYATVRVPGPPGGVDRLRPVSARAAGRPGPAARGRRAPAGWSRAARATGPQGRPPGRARARGLGLHPQHHTSCQVTGGATASCSKARGGPPGAGGVPGRHLGGRVGVGCWPPWRAAAIAVRRRVRLGVIAPGGAAIWRGDRNHGVRVRQLVVHRAREHRWALIPLAMWKSASAC
jgi:hypothetical protein